MVRGIVDRFKALAGSAGQTPVKPAVSGDRPIFGTPTSGGFDPRDFGCRVYKADPRQMPWAQISWDKAAEDAVALLVRDDQMARMLMVDAVYGTAQQLKTARESAAFARLETAWMDYLLHGAEETAATELRTMLTATSSKPALYLAGVALSAPKLLAESHLQDRRPYPESADDVAACFAIANSQPDLSFRVAVTYIGDRNEHWEALAKSWDAYEAAARDEAAGKPVDWSALAEKTWVWMDQVAVAPAPAA